MNGKKWFECQISTDSDPTRNLTTKKSRKKLKRKRSGPDVVGVRIRPEEVCGQLADVTRDPSSWVTRPPLQPGPGFLSPFKSPQSCLENGSSCQVKKAHQRKQSETRRNPDLTTSAFGSDTRKCAGNWPILLVILALG